MGLVDIAILAILVGFLLKGIFRGLLREICSLLGLVLGGVFAFTFHVPLAQALTDRFSLSATIAVWGAFLAIFLLVVLLFAVLGFVLHRFVKLVLLGGFNRLAGGLFGIIQGVVILAIFLLILNSQVAPQKARGMVRASQLAPPFIELGESIFTGSRGLVGH